MIINQQMTTTDLLNILQNEYYDSAWKGHLEFALWLVRRTNPRVTVELGVDYGHSTFALAAGNSGHVYGIDSFEGDDHAGHRDTYQIVMEMKSELLNKGLLSIDNITLIKSFFMDAVKTFSEKIDVLHIDGLHTYEAVKEDYESWITKTNTDAIILFHDVVSYTDTVGRFFDELPLTKYFFSHSAGLGVTCTNAEFLKDIMSYPDIPNRNQLFPLYGTIQSRYQVLYGLEENWIDVTLQCLYKCIYKNQIIIPYTDEERANIFGDPIIGIIKHVVVVDKIRNTTTTYENETDIILYL